MFSIFVDTMLNYPRAESVSCTSSFRWQIRVEITTLIGPGLKYQFCHATSPPILTLSKFAFLTVRNNIASVSPKLFWAFLIINDNTWHRQTILMSPYQRLPRSAKRTYHPLDIIIERSPGYFIRPQGEQVHKITQGIDNKSFGTLLTRTVPYCRRL